MNMSPLNYEYAIVGGGPAALCAIAKLVHLNVSPQEILWVDPSFKVGDFGTKLSKGSSIPSNTKVVDFTKINEIIYQILPDCAPTEKERRALKIYSLPLESHCPLSIAAEPMQQISNKLRKLVQSIKGKVLNIDEQGTKWKLTINTPTLQKIYLSKRVILALGAKPKAFILPEPLNQIPLIDPYVGFIQSECNEYLKNTPGVKTVAVFGSSHSAALAVMNFRKAGIPVKQFMNKPYRFAVSQVSSMGTPFTRFDNTGLKGEVAEYIKALLETKEKGDAPDWGCFAYTFDNPDIREQIATCSHMLAAIGFQTSSTLQVNKIPVNKLTYNKNTTEITAIKNLFGFGIAFPQEVKALSGEVELAVGYSKFWTTANCSQVVEAWIRP